MENELVQQNNKTRSTLILVFSILIMILVMFLVPEHLDTIKAFITRSGPLGLFVSIGIYALMGVTLIPSEPITILIGALFGPWSAMLIAGIGNTLAAFIEYYIGKNVSNVSGFMEQREKLPFGLGKLPADSPYFLIFGRMVPGYGSKVVSVLSGLYKVPILRYLWTAALPSFIGAAMFAFGGYKLFQLF